MKLIFKVSMSYLVSLRSSLCCFTEYIGFTMMLRAREMVEWVKALTLKPDNLEFGPSVGRWRWVSVVERPPA